MKSILQELLMAINLVNSGQVLDPCYYVNQEEQKHTIKRYQIQKVREI